MAGNLQVLLAARPTGWVKESDFTIVDGDVPQPGQGQLLLKNIWLSLDPYMRGRMDDSKSYAASVALGAVMVGGTVSVVVESNNPQFRAGDHVVGNLGWQQYAVSDGTGLQRVDPNLVPLSAYLGAVGMPGVTAWYGLLEIGQPKAGETVVVSAASGAVGSVVGQIAKMRDCRVVGIAGGREKCDYVVHELGFDACVDYKTGDLHEALKAATPKGVDVYFDNVGGPVLDTVLRRLNAFARIPLCGLISGYNATEPYGLRNIRSLLVNRVRLQGFIVSDHLPRWPEALQQLGGWVAQGKLRYRETVATGLEAAPKAFIGMLRGENFGKQLVRIADH
jgi:NADPH-dependent curcumin reductase